MKEVIKIIILSLRNHDDKLEMLCTSTSIIERKEFCLFRSHDLIN